MTDEKAVRLRANALAAGRVFSTTLQNHRRQQRQQSGADHQLHGPDHRAPMPTPASQVRHRAELPVQIPGFTDAVTQASQRAAWRSSTALAPVQPTVLAP